MGTPSSTRAFERVSAHPKHRFDYVARRGERIGFSLDPKFLKGTARVAVKASFYDGYKGELALRYRNAEKIIVSAPVATQGSDQFRTATFFIEADFGKQDQSYDIEIISENQVPISFVRVIKLSNEFPSE